MKIMVGLLMLSTMMVPGTVNSDYPPAKYQGNNDAHVYFVDDPNATCGPAPQGYVINACTYMGKKVIIMPNPCLFNGESFAKLMCHEKGHVNGWNRTHDN